MADFLADECSDSFLINFTPNPLCTFDLGDDVSSDYSVGYDTSQQRVEFIFTKGKETSGSYRAFQSFVVDSGTATDSAPDGVTYTESFSDTPDFTKSVSEMQTVQYTWTINIERPDPDDGTGGFQGTSLSVDVSVGFKRT